MTIKQYDFCLSEVSNYTDAAAYIADVAMSNIWGDTEPNEAVALQRIEDLEGIWTACHRTIKEIAATAGISMRRMGMRFGVKPSTMDTWGANKYTPPLHTRLLLQEALGIYSPNIAN